MKISRLIFAAMLMMAVLLAAVKPAQAAEADGQWFSFVPCTSNNPGDVAIGQAQLFMHVENMNNGTVRFNFTNLGPAASSITQIYIQDGLLEPPPTIQEDPDGSVNFTWGVPNGNPVLPGQNGCPGGFTPTKSLGVVESIPPVQPNGINPGEWLGLTYTVSGDYATIMNLLTTGVMKIGFHVQGYESGGSESFINTLFTAISLASFKAVVARPGVALKWTTGTELANAGFNLYRSKSEMGARVKLTGGLVAAKGDAVSGATYQYTDQPGYGTFYYWLEDVDTSGKSTLHGPVKITVAAPVRLPLYRPSLLGVR